MIKIVAIIMAFLTVCAPIVSAADGKNACIPNDAVEFGDHYYKVFREQLDWNTAEKRCEDLGGHLVTITSKEEQVFVESLSSGNAWIGGYRLGTDDWQWITGESFEYTCWNSGEPNNSDNVLANENRIAVWPKQWNDLNENSLEQSAYICEWDEFAPSISLIFGNDIDESSLLYNPSSDIKIPVDAAKYNGHFYKVFREQLDWNTAEKRCEELGGHLVTITSKEEQVFVESLSSGNAWIGGYRLGSDDWQWITGESFDYTYWSSGEPNNSDNVLANENRIAAWPKQWNDLNENSLEQSAFICEWDVIAIDSDNDHAHIFAFYPGEAIEDLVFSEKSTEYNPRLAHFLGCMARSAYTQDLVIENYRELGFSDYIQRHYDEGDLFAAFTIGKKQLDDGSLIVLITIRGTKDSREWLETNFHLTTIDPPKGWHDGFGASAIQVYTYLKAYLGGSIISENITYVICGHSLGAAVGNLLSIILYKDGVAINDLYDYNIACPNVAIGSKSILDWNYNGCHNNIINIGNWCDIVSYLPGDSLCPAYSPIRWKKYGVSYWFNNGWQFLFSHDMTVYLDYLEKELDETHFTKSEFKTQGDGSSALTEE